DVHEQLTSPLQAIPDFLFGPHAEMGYDELSVRAAWVSAYPHLAQALVRHLERSGRQSCTKAEATRLIAAVDAKWTEGYTALKWGQLLDPWFQLAPEGLD